MRLPHLHLFLGLFVSITAFFGTETIGFARSDYYYDDSSLRKLAQEGKPVVFFSTGWSGSGLGKMYKGVNQAKQARGFSIAYSLALRMYHLGIAGKVFYLTTKNVNEAQRKYLFNLHKSNSEHALLIPISNPSKMEKSGKSEFEEFEEKYFEQVVFSIEDLIWGLPAHDERRYIWLLEGENKNNILHLRNEVAQLKKNNAIFAGIEYHFGGPFFQEFTEALGLAEMPLLGSEIYDQVGDDCLDSKKEKNPPKNKSNWQDVEFSLASMQKKRAESKIPRDLGTKSQCRRLYRDVGVLHPRGLYNPVRDVDTLVKEIYTFLKANRDVVNIVVKLERSSAGDGNRTYKLGKMIKETKEFWTDESLAHQVIKAKLEEQFSPAYQRRMHDHGAVFEAFISGEKFESPAVLGMITPQSVEVYFDYNQRLGGNDGQTYQGSIGPASNQHMPDFKPHKGAISETDLKTPSTKILEGLKKCGAMGAVGIDFVTCEELNSEGKKVRNAYAIENNVRHSGTMYPYRTLFYLVGKEILEKKYFTSKDSIKVEKPKKHQGQHLRSWFYQRYLPNNQNHYNPITHTGCIVYIDTWVKGKVGIACIADTKKELEVMFKDFGESITTDVSQYIRELR